MFVSRVHPPHPSRYQTPAALMKSKSCSALAIASSIIQLPDLYFLLVGSRWPDGQRGSERNSTSVTISL